MAFDEGVAQRLREVFLERSDIVEKRMFGGIRPLLRAVAKILRNQQESLDESTTEPNIDRVFDIPASN